MDRSWSDVVSVAAGYQIVFGVKSDGAVVAAGYNIEGQCDVGTWNQGIGQNNC